MKKELRQKQILRRKNFLPTLIVTVLLWTTLGVIVYFIDPSSALALPFFILIFFLALLFTFSTIFANSRRGFLLALTITIFIILRYFGVGNILNFLLISGLLITMEIYFSRK